MVMADSHRHWVMSRDIHRWNRPHLEQNMRLVGEWMVDERYLSWPEYFRAHGNDWPGWLRDGARIPFLQFARDRGYHLDDDLNLVQDEDQTSDEDDVQDLSDEALPVHRTWNFPLAGEDEVDQDLSDEDEDQDLSDEVEEL